MRAWNHPIFVWFSKAMDTARGGGVDVICFLHHVEMPWRMTEIIWGAVLLRYPYYRRIFCSLSHLLSPFLHWKMCSMSSVMCSYPLGHLAEVHAPLLPIKVPVRSFLETIIVAHICIGLGAFFVVRCSNSQSTKWWIFA